MNNTALAIPSGLDEVLSAKEWAAILGVTDREIRKIGRQLSRRELKPLWRERINGLLVEHGLSSCRDLSRHLSGCAGWRPSRKLISFKPDPQIRAGKIRDCVLAFYAAKHGGAPRPDCEAAAIRASGEAFGKEWSDRTVRNWVARIDGRGGPGAPLEAYLDGRAGAAKPGRQWPPDFEAWFRAQFLDSARGVPSLGNIHAQCLSAWEVGGVPGLGSRASAGGPFPYTAAQLRRLMPGRAAREIAGRGKFHAKTEGYLASLPHDWSLVEPCRVVMFDDKVLDIMVQTDDGLRVFRPHIYMAYCAGTRRVLAFVAREENRMTQLDVEGLQAAVLRDHGFGGPACGWPTVWVKERGTISISDARKGLLESLFRGHLEIHRTMMVGGRAAPGDWVQSASGNFFGKGVLEALMGSLDHMAKILPAQTGRNYIAQPAVLGDTTLSLDTIINSARAGHKPAGSLLEESLLTSAMARLIDYHERGQMSGAREASARSGIAAPGALHYTDFVAMLGEIFRAHNARRGHRMQGFATLRVPHPDPAHCGQLLHVAESPNDKAARMFAAMRHAGRVLQRPHDADIAAMLHKIKRVTVTPSGVLTERLRYWSPQSNLCAYAASIAGASTVRWAIYNPISPDALYILRNPASHLPANATEIPPGFVPQLEEVLPLYDAPSPVDRDAQARRSASIAALNARFMREAVLRAEPILLARSEAREALRDRLEPLRATVRSAAPQDAPDPLPPSHLSGQLASAEAATRADQRRETETGYAGSLDLQQPSEY